MHLRLRSLCSLVGALALGAAVVAACSSSDGRALPPPSPGQTTTTPSTPIVPEGDGEVFELSSSAFQSGEALPVRFTCNGIDVSPDLQWSGIPQDAVELVLIVRDQSEGGFLHWVVAGIDPFVTGFGEGGLPENAVEATNDAGTDGWLGPCPAAGSGTHAFELVLHVLPEASGIVPGSPGSDAAALVETISLDQAVMTVTVTAGGTETSADASVSINEPSIEG